MKPINKEIFRAYDIRGVVDQDFDEDWVTTLGRACARFFLSRGYASAIVGHDCRESSPAYQLALAKGLAAAGVDVTLLNMVPTPVFYYAVKKLDRAAGVVITASHNPPEYNGFKIWTGATTLHTADIQELCAIMQGGEFPAGRGLLCEHDIIPSYIDDLAAQFTSPAAVKVVVDGGNGAGGQICAELLRRIGAEVVELHCVPDGRFPNHHPDPVVEANMADLKAAVLREGARCGIGLDGDADRLGVIDERGQLMYGDHLLAIFARDLLARQPGATIIAEGKCSHLLYKDIAAHGGTAIMGVTGHSIMKARVIETRASLAGEMSGHIFFADRYYGFDDAIYAAARLVEILGRTPQPLSTWLSDWPETCSTPELRVDCPDHAKFAIVERAQEYFGSRYETITIDGVRLTFPDGWALLRASNTQPVLVLRFEAETADRLAEIRRTVEEPLGSWLKELA